MIFTKKNLNYNNAIININYLKKKASVKEASLESFKIPRVKGR